ncbi:hypothetical protein SCANM63S_09021 [Streptomyces canarius]
MGVDVTSPVGDVHARSPGAGQWLCVVRVPSPAHGRLPRPPRGVQADPDDIAAALDEPDPDGGVVRRAAVVVTREEARFPLVSRCSKTTSTVSASPKVPTVYSRVSGGSTVKSACSPGPSPSGADRNGTSPAGPPGAAGGYQRSTNSLSAGEGAPGGRSPPRYCSGSSTSPGPNGSVITDCGSHTEPPASQASSGRSTFVYVVSRLQKFGGPASSA